MDMNASTKATSMPYPASTRTVSDSISNIPTVATCISFSDKILLTVSQAGRMNHWVHVPLFNAGPSESALLNGTNPDEEERPDSTLLPFTHLTATTVLGGTKPEVEVLGQTLATTVASAILMRNADEQRTLVVGTGFEDIEMVQRGFDGLVGLCLKVI